MKATGTLILTLTGACGSSVAPESEPATAVLTVTFGDGPPLSIVARFAVETTESRVMLPIEDQGVVLLFSLQRPISVGTTTLGRDTDTAIVWAKHGGDMAAIPLIADGGELAIREASSFVIAVTATKPADGSGEALRIEGSLEGIRVP